jgi:DNA excision repair protein ERCC-2
VFKTVLDSFAKSNAKTLLVCNKCGFIQEASQRVTHRERKPLEQSRPWQAKTVQRILELVSRGRNKIILDGPTGSGKTRIALLALKELQKTKDLHGLVTVRTITEMRSYDRDIEVFKIPLRYKYLIGKRRGCSYWTEGDDRGSDLCDSCLLKSREYDPNKEGYRTIYDEENARRIRDPDQIAKNLKYGLAYLEQRYVKNENERVCLYRSLKEIDSDFDLASYPYLLNRSIREASGIDLAKSIVMVDEAHNLETASQDDKIISLASIDNCSKEFREKCLPLLVDWREDRSRARVSLIYDSLTELRKIVSNFAGEDQTHGRHLDKDTFASEVKRNPKIIEEINTVFKKIEILKQNLAKAKVKEGLRNPFFGIKEFVDIASAQGKEGSGYELFSYGPGRLLFRSVDPSLVLSALNDASVLILMSGTMPPADYVERVWGIPGCEEIRITRDYPDDYYSVFPREAKRLEIFENVSTKYDERNDELWTKYAELIDQAFTKGNNQR